VVIFSKQSCTRRREIICPTNFKLSSYEYGVPFHKPNNSLFFFLVNKFDNFYQFWDSSNPIAINFLFKVIPTRLEPTQGEFHSHFKRTSNWLIPCYLIFYVFLCILGLWHKDAIDYLAFSILTLLNNNKVCPNLSFQMIYVSHLLVFQLSKLLPILMRSSKTEATVTIYVRVLSVLHERCFFFSSTTIHFSFHSREKCTQ